MTRCGPKDDTVDVESFTGDAMFTKEFVMEHQAAVGQLKWIDTLGARYDRPGTVEGMRWATGVLVGEDLLLTAGHNFRDRDLDRAPCITRPKVDGTTDVIAPSEIAKNMVVCFNYQLDPAGNLRTEERVPVVELLEYYPGGRDIAVARLDGKPGQQFGFRTLAAVDATPNDPACLIQHPQGRPKRVDNGPVFAVDSQQIQYNDIDTFDGSSGSPILDASGDIIGIHVDGRCDPFNIHANFGVPVSAISAVSEVL